MQGKNGLSRTGTKTRGARKNEALVLRCQTCDAIDTSEVTGKALVCHQPISFLGQIDPDSGRAAEGLDIAGKSVKGRILVYPTGAGSTVGSYVILNLKMQGRAPKGIINQEMDTVVLSGAIWADIPVAHRFEKGADPMDLIETGDTVTIYTKEKMVVVLKH